MRMLVFGASVTQGFYDEEGGWVDRLKREKMTERMNGKGDWTVFNLATSGDTSTDVLRRIHNEIKDRVWLEDEVAVVVSVGNNDSMMYADGHVRTSPEEYRENMTQIIKRAREFTDKIVFVGLLPCNESFTNPVSWGEYYFTNEGIKQNDEIMKSVAKEMGVEFVDVYDIFAAKNTDGCLLQDGLHPNTAGHKLLYDVIKPRLEEILR